MDIHKNICKKEFQKIISFVSENIISYKWEADSIILNVLDEADIDGIISKINRISNKFINTHTDCEVYFENDIKRDTYFDVYNAADGTITEFGNGQIGFSEKGVFLFEYFDCLFENMALLRGAIKKVYPVLLPVSAYRKTGYINKSPQYAMFCCSASENMETIERMSDDLADSDCKKDLSEPVFALSPSACFHTYLEYENKKLDKNTLLTFRQNVFRNEGRLNYRERGRLMDYHVREIVMLGDEKYVCRLRKEMMDGVSDIIKDLELKGNITAASDPFILPKMQLYKKIQKIDKSKYEVHLNVSEENEISAASFNLHGKAFTDPFGIAIDNCPDTVTACVGFGIQRWVIAFLSQYGFDEESWPEKVRRNYIK